VFYLRPYLSHSSSRIRGHAVIALWEFEDQNSLKCILSELLNGEKKSDKIGGIYAIGEVRSEDYRAELVKFIDHLDLEIRLHALIALTKMGYNQYHDALLEILLGEDIPLAQCAYHMLKRVPQESQDRLQREIQFAVAQRVFALLKPQKIKVASDLKKLSKKGIQQLKHFYQLARKYDDMLVMEKI
jgi:hypothetical protein